MVNSVTAGSVLIRFLPKSILAVSSWLRRLRVSGVSNGTVWTHNLAEVCSLLQPTLHVQFIFMIFVNSSGCEKFISDIFIVVKCENSINRLVNREPGTE